MFLVCTEATRYTNPLKAKFRQKRLAAESASCITLMKTNSSADLQDWDLDFFIQVLNVERLGYMFLWLFDSGRLLAGDERNDRC